MGCDVIFGLTHERYVFVLLPAERDWHLEEGDDDAVEEG